LHYLDAEYWTRGLPRTFTTFDNLINDPVNTFKTIEKNLDFVFPVPISQAGSSLSQFISKDLVHHRNEDADYLEQTELINLAMTLYRELIAAVSKTDSQTNITVIDNIRLRINAIQESFPPLLVEQLRSTYKIRSDSQLTLIKIFRSWSWIAGKPIRFIERLLGRDV